MNLGIAAILGLGESPEWMWLLQVTYLGLAAYAVYIAFKGQ